VLNVKKVHVLVFINYWKTTIL